MAETVAGERHASGSSDTLPGDTSTAIALEATGPDLYGSDVKTNSNSSSKACLLRQYSLVDKPDDTPFLQRLKDPFEDSVTLSRDQLGRSLFGPPPAPALDSTHDITKCRQRDLQLLQLSPWKLRSGHSSKDSDMPPPDTQVIRHNEVPLQDTQVIGDSLENGLDPTQRIVHTDDPDTLSDNLLVADNGVVIVPNPTMPQSRPVMGPTQMDAGSSFAPAETTHSQVFDTPTQLRLTQKVHGNGADPDTSIAEENEPTDLFDTLGYHPDGNDSLGQIRFLASHREVPNTQDSILDTRSELGVIALEEDIEIVLDDETHNESNKPRQYSNNQDTQRIHMTQKTTLAPNSDHQTILGLGSPTVISDSSPTAVKQIRSGSNGTSQIPDTSNTQVVKVTTLPPSSPTLKQPFTTPSKSSGGLLSSIKIDLTHSNNPDVIYSATQSLELGKAKLEKTLTDDQEEVVIPNSHQRKHKFVIDSQNEGIPRLLKKQRGPQKETSIDILREEPLTVLTEKDIVFKSSVWALYNLRVYSGILLNLGDEVLEVEFEEGAYQVKNEDLHLLDIRVGDTIRLKSKVAKFTVVGLRKTPNEGDSVCCCVRGFNSVLVKRQSTKSKSFAEIEVPLSECWMEIGDLMEHEQGNAMLINGRSRSQFESFGELCEEIGDVASPQVAINTEASSPVGDLESSPMKEHKSRSSPIKSVRSEETKLFSGRLFVLTSVSGNKQALCDVILRNGGAILEGFEKHLRCGITSEGICIVIDGQFAHYRFACVVSSSYCRSAKYLQALALGWPVISDAYIFDSIRNANRLESWGAYLLPSGKSKYLGDAVKSMDIYRFHRNYENECTLDDQLQNNAGLLEGVDVLILKQNMSNMVLETAVFIFHAFGAKSLNYIVDVGQITSTIENMRGNDGGSRILVFEVGTTVRKSVESSFDIPEPGRVTRSRSGIAQKLAAVEHNQATVGFVDWEWLVQCVISNHIWDPDYFHV